MQTFAEFMAESFHSESRLTWNYLSPSHATALFRIDLIKVTVPFERRDPDGQWHVVFEVEQGESTEVAHAAFEIFNGVFQSVEEFVSVREPEIVVLATKRDKLAGVYQTYLRKESATLKELGYELQGPVRVDPFMEFTLRRVKPSAWRPS